MDGITIDGCVHLLLDRDLRLSAFIVLANLLLLALQHLQLGDVEFLGEQSQNPCITCGAASAHAYTSAPNVHHVRTSSALMAISLAFSSASCLMKRTICEICFPTCGGHTRRAIAIFQATMMTPSV